MSVMRIVRAVHELHELACRLKKHIGYFQHEVVVLYNLVFFVCAWKNCVNFPKRSQGTRFLYFLCSLHFYYFIPIGFCLNFF